MKEKLLNSLSLSLKEEEQEKKQKGFKALDAPRA